MSDRGERHFVEPFAKFSPERLNSLCHLIIQVQFDRSERGGTADRVSKERRGMQRLAGRPRPGVHDLCPTNASGHGKSAGHSFPETEQVRINTELITGEKGSGAIEPSINLVENKQDL